MGVYKRGNVYHYKFYREGIKKPFRGTCRTGSKKEAEEFERHAKNALDAQFIAEQTAANEIATLGNPQTVDECLKSYIDKQKAHRPKSVTKEESVCNRLRGIKLHKQHKKIHPGKPKYTAVAGLDPQSFIHEITLTKLRLIISQWSQEKDVNGDLKPLSQASQKQAIDLLRRALELSAEDENRRVPNIKFKQITFGKSVPKQRYFKPEEERKFLAELKKSHEPENYHLAIFLFDTGARITEALQFTFEGIQHGQDRLLLRRFKTETDGDATTYIDFTPRLKATLEHLEKNRNLDSPYLFRDKDNNGAKKYSDRWFNEACKRAKLNKSHLEKFTQHSIRRTFCTRLLLGGMSLTQCSVLMGHSNTAVTESRYGWIKSEDVKTQARKILQDFNEQVHPHPTSLHAIRKRHKKHQQELVEERTQGSVEQPSTSLYRE